MGELELEQLQEKIDAGILLAQQRLKELIRENSGDSRALKAHTYSRIYPAIALYESFRTHGTEPERAVWYIREYFQRFADRYVPFIRLLIKVSGLAKEVPGIFKKMSLRAFGPEAGFEYEFPESSGREARFIILSCPYARTCGRYGVPELTRAFCDGDDAGYGDLHPKLIWGRTKTIGRGAECCDFLLKYRE